jgi:chorismate mutase
MNDDNLENLREKINETDNKILDLLDVRSKIVYQIGKLKKKI